MWDITSFTQGPTFKVFRSLVLSGKIEMLLGLLAMALVKNATFTPAATFLAKDYN